MNLRPTDYEFNILSPVIIIYNIWYVQAIIFPYIVQLQSNFKFANSINTYNRATIGRQRATPPIIGVPTGVGGATICPTVREIVSTYSLLDKPPLGVWGLANTNIFRFRSLLFFILLFALA